MNPHHLRWGSNLDNNADKARLGRAVAPQGSKHPNSKLTEAAVIEIRTATGKYRDLAVRYGVTFGMIGHIKRRRAWAHIP